MRFEFSAGGVVLRQAQDFGSKPQSSKKNWEVLVSQHSQHHGWVFPKGLIGDHVKGEKKSASAKGFGETKEEAAVREVEEETGVSAKILKPLSPVTYWYLLEEEKIKKTVYYYIMEYLGGDFKNRDQEMESVEWVELDKVLEKLTYESDKQAFKEAKPIIIKLAG